MTDKTQEIQKAGRTYDRRGFRRIEVPKIDLRGEITIDEKIHSKLDPDELIPKLPLRNEFDENIHPKDQLAQTADKDALRAREERERREERIPESLAFKPKP